MGSKNKNTNTNYPEPKKSKQEQEQEQEHVHGPGCNHESQKPIVRDGVKVGRNDPCSCGSGKKFKKCCGK